MLYIRLFMKLQSYTMTTQITHYRKTIFTSMFINSIAYITNKAIRLSHLHAYLQALFCHTN